MGIRNFWIDLNVDGRRTPVGTGPRADGGGFSMNVFMNEGGSSRKILDIMGYAIDGGTLKLFINTEDGKYLEYTTKK